VEKIDPSISALSSANVVDLTELVQRSLGKEAAAAPAPVNKAPKARMRSKPGSRKTALPLAPRVAHGAWRAASRARFPQRRATVGAAELNLGLIFHGARHSTLVEVMHFSRADRLAHPIDRKTCRRPADE